MAPPGPIAAGVVAVLKTGLLKAARLKIARLTVGLLTVTVVGCSPALGSADVPALSASASVPAGDRAAIDATVAAVNAGAGQPVAAQRTVLEAVVDPTQRARQRSCRPAATTIRFEPAWPDLRRTGDGRYVLPTLIRVYQGTRITGTDVGALKIVITAGQAHLPPLCVS